jgi:ferric-dicitrate binding protein FerR (iron transport regulator)
MIEESEIETTVTVEEGKVAFTDKTTSKMIQLTANEVGVFQVGGVLFQEQTEVPPGPQVIQLRKETLARLVAQLGRRHDWTITLDDAIQTCTITGEFDLNQPQATLNKIMELGYQIKKKTANQYQITGVCK